MLHSLLQQENLGGGGRRSLFVGHNYRFNESDSPFVFTLLNADFDSNHHTTLPCLENQVATQPEICNRLFPQPKHFHDNHCLHSRLWCSISPFYHMDLILGACRGVCWDHSRVHDRISNVLHFKAFKIERKISTRTKP